MIYLYIVVYQTCKICTFQYLRVYRYVCTLYMFVYSVSVVPTCSSSFLCNIIYLSRHPDVPGTHTYII